MIERRTSKKLIFVFSDSRDFKAEIRGAEQASSYLLEELYNAKQAKQNAANDGSIK